MSAVVTPESYPCLFEHVGPKRRLFLDDGLATIDSGYLHIVDPAVGLAAVNIDGYYPERIRAYFSLDWCPTFRKALSGAYFPTVASPCPVLVAWLGGEKAYMVPIIRESGFSAEGEGVEGFVEWFGWDDSLPARPEDWWGRPPPQVDWREVEAKSVKYLWPPAVVKGNRPSRIIMYRRYATLDGVYDDLVEMPMPSHYAESLARLYGVDRPVYITEEFRVPGAGKHLGERFAVYYVKDDYLQIETPWGLDFALNFVLGTVGDKWVLMGKDGLYEAVFKREEGAGGKVGYAEVIGPYEGEVKAVEGPHFFGLMFPVAKSMRLNCAAGSLLFGGGVCFRDEYVFRTATRWPLERHDGYYPEAAARLIELVRGIRMRGEIRRGVFLDVVLKEGAGSALLHAAARLGDAEAVRLLLERGADPNARDAYGETPLHYAAKMGWGDVVEVLLKAGADPNAARGGSTPLHYAVGVGASELPSWFYRDLRVVRLLLEHGADPNVRDEVGRTPLHYAAMRGWDEAVEVLLGKGADPHVVDSWGYAPLHYAAWEGYHPRVVRAFLKFGVDVNLRNAKGETLLHIALWSRDAVADLLKLGADVNARDAEGTTPLHCAVYQHRLDVVELLLKEGADVNARDSGGRTPLHLAASLGYNDAVELLLRHGADINARDNEGRTPLHYAAAGGPLTTVMLLVELGADIRAVDSRGLTPSRLAEERGRALFVRYLKERGG